jgi:hypothetical protein
MGYNYKQEAPVADPDFSSTSVLMALCALVFAIVAPTCSFALPSVTLGELASGAVCLLKVALMWVVVLFATHVYLRLK